MEDRSLKSRTIASLLWKFLERGGNQAVQLLVQIVLARLLMPEDFGALAILLVFVNLGTVVVQSGLNTALVQALEVDDDDCSTVFWMSFGVSLLLYTVLCVAAPAIAEFYGMPHLVWPLRALGVILPIGSFNSVQVAIVQRALEFRKVFNATLASALISGVVGITAAAMGAGLWALIAQQIFFQLCSCAVLGLNVRWIPRPVFMPERAKRLFGFGWKLLVSGLLDQGYQSLSDLIIGRQFSAASLGFVSQGKKYPHALGSMLDGAIQPVMLSAVSRVQSDMSQVKRLVRRALRTSTYLIVPAMTLFAVEAEPVVRLLLGERWLPAVPFMRMYCFVFALLPIHTTNLQALNGVGRSDLFLRLELIKKAYGVAFLLVAAFVLQDIHLMVASYMVTGIISTFVNSRPNKRVIGYSYTEQLRDIAPAFALSALAGTCSFAVSCLGLPDVPTVLLEAGVMVAVYLAASKVFRVEAFAYLAGTASGIIRRRGGGAAHSKSN